MSYELIETVEVGSGGASSIEFTSIPQDGTDLIVKLSIRVDAASGAAIYTYFNSLAVEDCPYVRLFGNGSSASSSSPTPDSYLFSGISNDSNDTADTFSNQEIYISNYTSSSKKSVSIDSVNENNDTDAFQDLIAGQWEGTDAITSLEIQSNSANLAQYSTASLYKITAA